MPAEDRVDVRNAADRKQVGRAGKRSDHRQRELEGAYVDVLNTESGRRVMWDLLERCGVYRSVWEPSAKIHYNAGRQDMGHELMALLARTDVQLYLKMEHEARVRDARDDSEREAYHIGRRELESERGTDGD